MHLQLFNSLQNNNKNLQENPDNQIGPALE